MSKPLTAQNFDATWARPARPSGPGIIWGLDAIGREMGRSVDWVRSALMTKPDSPVQCMDGRYYAIREKLWQFMADWKEPD